MRSKTDEELVSCIFFVGFNFYIGGGEFLWALAYEVSSLEVSGLLEENAPRELLSELRCSSDCFTLDSHHHSRLVTVHHILF